MAKKVNYTPYIIGVAAVGGIVLWQSGKLDKLFGKKDETPELPPLEPEADKPVIKKEIVVKPVVDATKNPVYMDKVRKLQLFLGAGVDGNAGGEGSQTNKMTKAKFPTLYANLGRVTPANIDAYLAETEKKTSVDLSKKTAEARKKFGQTLFQLGATGKKVRPKSTILATVMYFDSARKQYVPSTRKTSISNYHLFSKWVIAGYTGDGFYILKSKTSPKDFVIVNPYSFEAI